ncbi:MAG: hypothetical protein L0G99_09785 [Propionibacteriales bacterium]|nr:hypothetical protein [Propionibacteriales bacterium]
MESIRAERTIRSQYLPRRWCRVTTGVHLRAEPNDRASVLLAWQEVLPPDARWTHLTAAAIRDWWLPPLPAQVPVLAAHGPDHRMRRAGLVSIRRKRTVPYDIMNGLRVDPASEIIAACARHLSELDLVCVVTAAVRSGACTLAELRQVAAPSDRGMRALRRVLARTDARHESIWEVLLAELHHACGIPVRAQHEVSATDGTFVARGDLWLVGTRRLHEYDGRWHGADRQRRADLRREGRILRAGWTRRGYVADDLLYRAVRILEDADQAIGRTHDPHRIRAWHRLVGRSLFTPSGRTALLRRLGVQEVEPSLVARRALGAA